MCRYVPLPSLRAHACVAGTRMCPRTRAIDEPTWQTGRDGRSLVHLSPPGTADGWDLRFWDFIRSNTLNPNTTWIQVC